MQACLILCLVVTQALASPFAARQISSTNSNDISVIGLTVTQEQPTSTTTVLSTKTEYTVVTPLSPWAVVSVVPYTAIVSGSITQIKSATLTLYPATYSAEPSTTTSSSSKRDGAIAGAVVGAVVVAGIAGIVFMRSHNKRSARHWRNRGPWLNLDGGDGGGGDVKKPPSPIIATVTVPSPTTAAPVLVKDCL
ncbi:uncharacterized protein BT62DRAFT_931811 [Guyanagaster necrorhizus]|uniref:Mid2 domain-containing protein n=1 Tax=Guyanagaster necrorhizus TaxID=856835 RepID=A0A9P8ATZ2_9AGAR|nr:uncharacterized protein BT62DRAFT_931811 [Guyanagaster necrorhizus MCA 3950]KAG7446362.1 hypothetical protein BT62DRAFT_931811 [Guyanagaster necrorhizus MCA 3950]